MAGPRELVDAPGYTALPYHLWDAVQQRPPGDNKWQNGIIWQDRCATGDSIYEECLAVTGTGGAPSGQASLTSNVVQTNRVATAFTVYTEFDCSPVGFNDALTIATDSLAKVEDWQVERAFWTGVSGKTSSGSVAQTTVFPHLASNGAINDPQSGYVMQSAASMIATGSGDDVAITMGQLEAAMDDCYHGRGIIHMPREALATFAAWMHLVNAFDTDKTSLYTPTGNRIVVGAGYNNTGPDGAAAPAGTAWVYGTGEMFGYRGDVHMANLVESFDRIENTRRVIAQRTYLLGWSCCHFAARINLGVPT